MPLTMVVKVMVVTLNKTTIDFFDAEKKFKSLETFLQRNDIIGYVASLNAMELEQKVKEFQKAKLDLIRKYGKEDQDGSFTITAGTDEYVSFNSEMHEFGSVCFDVSFYTLKPSQVIGKITGNQVMEFRWMIDFDDGGEVKQDASTDDS